MSLQTLKARLADGLAPADSWRPETRAAKSDFDLNPGIARQDRILRPAAVLVPIIAHETGATVLLTRRADGLTSHPGQIAFPGGRLDPGETAVEAALREAQEEVGLDPASVEVFGRLPQLWLPPSNFAVTPILGWWRDPGEVSIVSAAEVHAIHRAPIAELLDPEHRIQVRHPAIGYESPGFLIGPDKDVILWGFTGGIIARLFDFLGWTRPWDQSRVRDLPPYMLQADPRGSEPRTDLLDIEDI